MKKFLFTLATLLMAGSMFAGENYFYMDNITLTKEEAANGCYKVVNVKAHFDEAVSAWQADFILPEGVTIGTQAKGSDLTLSFLGQFEDEETLETYYQQTTFTPEIGTNGTKTRVIISVGTVKEYDEAHHGYGVCWRPGDYEQMWRVRFEFPAGFKGGDIVLHSEASCSKGIWPGLTPCELNPVNKTTEVRIKADTPEIAVTGDDYSKTVTITAEEGATIYYSTDGEIYQVYNAPIVFDEEGTYKVYAYAEGPGEGVERKSKSDVAESDEFTILKEQPKDLTGDITISDADENGKFTVTYDGEEDVTLTVKVGEDVVTADADGKYSLPDYGTYTVTATASATDYNDLDAEKELTWKKTVNMPTIEGKVREGSKKYFDIIITPDANTDGELVYTAYPMGTVLGAKAEPVTIQYERGNEDYYVDVTAYTEGTATYNQSETAEARIKVPKLDQVATPEINYVVNGDKITITTTCETDDATVVLVGPDGTRYENGTATVTFDPSQGYLETWTATASAQDMLDSETAQKVIDIPAVPKTQEPTINVSFGEAGDNTVAYVTFKNNDEKPATIWYSTDGGDTWNKYDPAVPVTFTATDENQEITVLAYAQAEGKLPSDEVDRTFELNNTATSVNELTNGKTVAGVRYFNMAGQEMQEANGITIVVTTYTDGTTSAVKVMK